MPVDFYDILGIDTDAPTEDIQRAYRDRVKEYHPDVNDHPRAHAQFKVLKRARDVLLDPSERNAYDRIGHQRYIEDRMPGSLPTTDFPGIGGGDTKRKTRPKTQEASVDRNSSPRSRPRSTPSRSTASRSNRVSRPTRGHAPTLDRFIGHLWVIVVIGLLSYSIAMGSVIMANTDRLRVDEIALTAELFLIDPIAAVGILAGERFGVPLITDIAMVAYNEQMFGVVVVISLALVIMPLTLAIAVILLRRRTVWQASYWYLVGGLSPGFAVAGNFLGIENLVVDLLLYLIVPIAVCGIFIWNRFR